MLNWIVWNKTVFLYKNGFDAKQPTNVDMSLNSNKQTHKNIRKYHVQKKNEALSKNDYIKNVNMNVQWTRLL